MIHWLKKISFRTSYDKICSYGMLTQVFDKAPATVKELTIVADAQSECNLIGQMTIDLPSIGNIAIVGCNHFDRCRPGGRSKQTSCMMPNRSRLLHKLRSEFDGADRN